MIGILNMSYYSKTANCHFENNSYCNGGFKPFFQFELIIKAIRHHNPDFTLENADKQAINFKKLYRNNMFNKQSFSISPNW